MDQVTDLVDTGGGEEETEVLTNLPLDIDSYMDEQKEKSGEELPIIDSDILELADQDILADSVEKTDIETELFLEGAEAKVTSEVEDDPSLAFLVGDTKMEVEEGDFSFLEEQEFESNSEYEEYSEENEESDDDEDDDDSEEEEDTDEKVEDDGEKKSGDKQEDDETVFGQVSFYDEEPEPKGAGDELNSSMATPNLIDDSKVPKKKIKKKKAKKRKAVDGAPTSAKRARKKRKKKGHKKSKEDGDEVGDDDEDDDLPKGGATQLRRKNIRSIMSEKDLDKDMLSAQNEELERQKRLMELKKALLKENAIAAVATSTTVASSTTSSTSTSTETSTKTASASTETVAPKEKDSQLKSLLQVAEEEAEKEAETKERKLQEKEVMKAKKETRDMSPPSDVITLSSESEDTDDLDDQDSDGVMVVPSDDDEEDEDEAEDVNNAGSHIDDNLNMADPDGRVKINIGHPSDDPDVYLAPQIAQAIKPHQIGGVRFLYDNLVESLDRYRTSPGFGCILAHSMGLGKTIQLISFIDIFIRCTGGKKVLCIVPINTIQNWLAEFNYWLPEKEKLYPDDDLTQPRVFPLYVINDSMKTTIARAAVIEKWKETGGVIIIGYEMFRLLSSKRVAPAKKTKSRARKPSQPEVIDVEEEDKNKSLMIDMHSALVDPGPDLVMCDEGHRIKNSSAAISQSLKTIKTRRRVVLTGYPLQNNLMEYWCMVDFVRPSFLGTKTEFSNMFERPIMNGQCMDSTAQDKKVMRQRSYVLHNLLEGFVQRRGHTVLKLSLPPKSEQVFLIRMSPIQRKIYCEFMNAISESGLCSWANNNPLKAFAVCCKVWNHPDVLHDVLTKRSADKDNDLDIDTGESSRGKKKASSQKSSSAAAIAAAAAAAASSSSTAPPGPLTPSASTTSLASLATETISDKNPITYDWAEDLMKDYIPGVLENGGKFVLIKSIMEECLAIGDKVLVFSQSLLTLNKLEEFFGRLRVPRPELNENWSRNRTYFRLDGSTSAQDREKLINQFNDPSGYAWMFLLSTKAGCLGINLIGANRVIVVDASWNPCHDCQAVCRVYRFGQVKSSFVYRLVTDNTLEKRIYDRQISKQGMSDRIVDDMNIENKFTRRQVENLLDFEDQDFPLQDYSSAETKYGNDSVLVRLLKRDGYWLTKQPFTHESLLIDRKELRLSKREKRLAKEGYARDKRMNVTYTRPSYAAYYPQQQGIFPNRMPLNSSYAAFRRGPIVRPIASVRPIISASAQNGAEKIKQFGGQPLRPGVTIHQVITTTEILLPGTNTGTQAGGSSNKIGAGQKILVIKTPKGVYIRTNDGKMFAVRSKGAGMGIDVGSGTASSTATTTLSASGGVFLSPGINMSSVAGGKKPPIIIVSNKKGMPLSMSRGGSIIRTLPYGSANLLSNLRPNILKAATSKTGETTSTTSSTSLKSSPSVSGEKKSTMTLSDLISEGIDTDTLDGEEAPKSTSEEGTQSAPSKMPVIVLPSLAVRTPRPPSKQPPPSTTSVTCGSTVVIMPTKPVVSMGTKRPAKNPKKKPNKSKDSIGVGMDSSDDRKKGAFSLLSASSSNAPFSGSVPGGMSTDMTAGHGTQSNAEKSSESQALQQPPSKIPQMQGQGTLPGAGGGQMPHSSNNPTTNQSPSPAFPDLNHMWQANFGSAPPPSSGLPTTMNQSSSSMSNMGVAPPQPSGPGYHGGNDGMAHPSMMPNNLGMMNGSSDNSNSGPSSHDINDKGSNQSNSNQMPGGVSGNPQTNTMGFTNQTFNTGSAGNSGSMGGSSFMPSSNSSSMNPYGMGDMMQGSMNPYMPPGMNPSHGFMQSNFNSNMQMQSQPQDAGNNSMMFGSSSPNPPAAPFGSSSSNPSAQSFGSSYSMHSNQQNSAPPPYGSSGAPGSAGQYPGQPGNSHPPPFGFSSSAMNYGSTPTTSSFSSVQQNYPSSTPSSQMGLPPGGVFNSHQSQDYNLDQLGNGNRGNGGGQTSSPFSSQHSQQPQLQHPLPQMSPSVSSASSSVGPPTPLSVPSYHGIHAESLEDKRESSPYSLTLLGNDPSNGMSNSNSSKSKRNRGSSSSRSSKATPSSSVHAARDIPNSTKMAKSVGGTTLSIPDPSSPRNATATPDRVKSSNLTNLSDHMGVNRSNVGLSHLSSTDLLSSVAASSHPSSNSSLNIPSLSNPLTNLPAFRPLISSPMGDTSSAGTSQFSSESGLGGSAFRAHPVSSFSNLPANPHPFRLDGAGGIGGIPSSVTSGLNYNSSMSAFSSPGGNVGGAYGSHAFGAYGSGYANPGALPFGSSPMMPPQAMMGYPQTGLGYPSMSSLMMGTPPPPAPSAMANSMWPMMPPSMMGGAAAYSYPHHPSSMGFPTSGFDGQGFGN